MNQQGNRRTLRPPLSQGLIALCYCLCACTASAIEGYELIGPGPISQGTAGAGAASGEDPSWMLINPAAIAPLENRFDFYVDFIHPERRLEGEGIVGNKRPGEQTYHDLVPGPGLGYIWKSGENTWGFGVFGAGGTGVEYDKPRSILGIVQNSDRRAELLVTRIPLTWARAYDNGWSLGVTLQANHMLFRSDNVTLTLRPTVGDYNWDAAVGLGFIVGATKDWDKFSIGGAYFSRQYMSTFRNYSKDLLSYRLDQPQKIQAGIAYRPTEKLELLLDYKWVNWGGVNQMGRSSIRGGLGWDNTHTVKFGMRYAVNDKLMLRAGIGHGNQPIDGESVFGNGLFPAITKTNLGLGFSYRIRPQMDLNMSYVHAFHNEEIETGGGDLFSILTRGTRVELEMDSVAIGITRHF